MSPIISVSNLTKTYDNDFDALREINLDIMRGEIFALLGPNGAGKTTLINTICGIVTPTTGTITIDGFDNVKNFRETRAITGLVPQELTTDAFETVKTSVNYSRNLFGKSSDPQVVEKILRDLSLWDKRSDQIITLSGGMKRRLLIAKALSHEPTVLFLDEPTAGVDVELRQDMWNIVRELQQSGVTIILTTHYIEEAEQMADRIGVINNGEIILVDEKQALMQKLGTKQLTLELHESIDTIPDTLSEFNLARASDGMSLTYTYDTNATRTGITSLLNALSAADIKFRDLNTTQSSLEDIFMTLVKRTP